MDAETGWVTLRSRLDYELMRRFTLTVLARDGGGEETTGRLRINVLDINDNAPVFQKEAYVGSLMENEQAAQQVVRARVRNFVRCRTSINYHGGRKLKAERRRVGETDE